MFNRTVCHEGRSLDHTVRSGGRNKEVAEGDHCPSFRNPVAAALSSSVLNTETGCPVLFQAHC